MGIGGIGIWQLLIVLAIVVLLFGGKRLRNLGGDIGSAIKGFKSAMDDSDKTNDEDSSTIHTSKDRLTQASNTGTANTAAGYAASTQQTAQPEART